MAANKFAQVMVKSDMLVRDHRKARNKKMQLNIIDTQVRAGTIGADDLNVGYK